MPELLVLKSELSIPPVIVTWGQKCWAQKAGVNLDSASYWSYIPETILGSHGKARGHPSAKTVVSYENRGQLEALRAKQHIPRNWFLHFNFIEATRELSV